MHGLCARRALDTLDSTRTGSLHGARAVAQGAVRVPAAVCDTSVLHRNRWIDSDGGEQVGEYGSDTPRTTGLRETCVKME